MLAMSRHVSVNLKNIFKSVLILFEFPEKHKIMQVSKKFATIVEGDPKAPFLIATTPRSREGRYSFPRIAPLYP